MIFIQVLPASVRGIVIGFASLSTFRNTAMYITFGSTSMGIPCALARVFKEVRYMEYGNYGLKFLLMLL